MNSILLVDDDPDDQLLFQEAMAETDKAVLCTLAVDGVDALEKLNSGLISKPDLVLMDMNMPRMNGIDCLKELKKDSRYSDIPVIMYSTSCIGEYQRQCFENGAIGYMEKPSDFTVLCHKLKMLLSEGPDSLTTDPSTKS